MQHRHISGRDLDIRPLGNASVRSGSAARRIPSQASLIKIQIPVHGSQYAHRVSGNGGGDQLAGRIKMPQAVESEIDFAVGAETVSYGPDCPIGSYGKVLSLIGIGSDDLDRLPSLVKWARKELRCPDGEAAYPHVQTLPSGAAVKS